MAEILLEDLKAALAAEGHKFKEDVIDRVFRKLANPSGCHYCGSNTMVGVASATKIVTACCNTKVADVAPEPKGT